MINQGEEQMQNSIFVLNNNTLVVPNGATPPAQTSETATPVDGAQSPAGDPGQSNFMFTFLYIAVIIAFMYFFFVRPQKKREKQIRQLQDSIMTGDPVVTSGGMYGKVVGQTEDAFVIEFGTNKGVCIPIRKSDVLPAKNDPDEVDTKKLDEKK